VALRAESDSAFYVTLNAMLFELGVSHIGVIPEEHPEWIGAPAVFAAAGIGVDVRVIDARIVVTRVRPGSAGARAGLRPGSIIQHVDGRTSQQLREEALSEPRPALDDRLLLNEHAQSQFLGPTGSEVEVSWIDGDGVSHTATIRRETRPNRAEFMEGIPPMFLEFEARWEGPGVGYVRFNAFHPALLEQILDALDVFQNAPGLIIDVRGNAGGAIGVRRTLVERVVPDPVVFWRYRYRDHIEELVVQPAPRVYRGRLVVLADAVSASSSEEFAGGLQAIGRAQVVGERTPGMVLVADVIELPHGATLVYPMAETVVADGTVLEGRGVIPDVEVNLTLQSLADGRDLQLQAAIELVVGPPSLPFDSTSPHTTAIRRADGLLRHGMVHLAKTPSAEPVCVFRVLRAAYAYDRIGSALFQFLAD
jgi:carboxyl-terminal processing protease